MPTIRFLAASGRLDAEVTAPDGGRLLDACDEHALPVTFSCRGATCGACRVEVLEGLDRLEPPGVAELELLATLGDTPAHRLACQARLAAGAGLVVLRIVRTDG